MARPCARLHEPSPARCHVCWLAAFEPAYQALWQDGAHELPAPTGCPAPQEREARGAPVGVDAAHACQAGTVRNLLFHLAPFAHSDRWRWHVQALRHRLALFNGTRTVAIVYGPNLVSPREVRAAFAGTAVEFLELPNCANRLDGNTLEALLGRVATLEPRHVTLWAHAKGVRYAPAHARYALTGEWAAMLYETYLDHWPLVQRLLSRRPLAGSFKRVGRAWAEHESDSDWHYSGAWFWFRNRDLFDKADWRRRDEHFWGSAESYPSLHFCPAEAGCIFHEADARGPYLYDANVMRTEIRPALAQWRIQHRADAMNWDALIAGRGEACGDSEGLQGHVQK